MNIEELYKLYERYPIVNTNSKVKLSGCLFFALKGANFNGNAYAYQAIENGAEYAIIDDEDYCHDERYILVDDVLLTLQGLANFHRQKMSIPIIGITGTNGKTTTKELVNAVLSQQYNVCCTQGNFNNHIGVPLTLLSITKKHEIAIIEMGANHVGEIADLCQIADPDLGIITNVGYAHLEGFGSYENIVKTKTALYKHIQSKSGTIFYNSSDELLQQESSQINRISYGCNNSADIIGSMSSSSVSAAGDVLVNNQKFSVVSNLFGSYNFINMLAAIAVGTYFKVSTDNMKFALENYTPSNNRSQIKHTDNNELILDAYNANPSSMLASVTHFIETSALKKAVILGEMLELGSYSKEEHKRILELVVNSNISLILLVGNWGSSCVCNDNVYIFEDTDKLRNWLSTHILRDYSILIKGSRGISLEKVIDLL